MLIYRNTTAIYINALTAYIYAIRTKGYVNYLDILRFCTNDSNFIAALDTIRT